MPCLPPVSSADLQLPAPAAVVIGTFLCEAEMVSCVSGEKWSRAWVQDIMPLCFSGAGDERIPAFCRRGPDRRGYAQKNVGCLSGFTGA